MSLVAAFRTLLYAIENAESTEAASSAIVEAFKSVASIVESFSSRADDNLSSMSAKIALLKAATAAANAANRS